MITPKDRYDSLAKLADEKGMCANEKAQFLANIAHETGGFKRLTENLNYSASRLMQIFPGRNGNTTLAQWQAIVAKGKEAIAEAIYGGEWGAKHLGNTKPGIAYMYIGKGPIMLTGMSNYNRVGKAIGVDLVSNPDLALDPDIGAKIAYYFWVNSKASEKAKAGDNRGARKCINGGYLGYEEIQVIAEQILHKKYVI